MARKGVNATAAGQDRSGRREASREERMNDRGECRSGRDKAVHHWLGGEYRMCRAGGECRSIHPMTQDRSNIQGIAECLIGRPCAGYCGPYGSNPRDTRDSREAGNRVELLQRLNELNDAACSECTRMQDQCGRL